jgi:hypothetical protein
LAASNTQLKRPMSSRSDALSGTVVGDAMATCKVWKKSRVAYSMAVSAVRFIGVLK